MRYIKIYLSSIIFFLSSTTLLKGGDYFFSVQGEKTYLNNHPILIVGLRCSNALMSDQITRQLIENFDIFRDYGVNTISVYLQGSRFGDIKGYRRDATLNPQYTDRLSKIIEAADHRGMVILVGCLYWGNSKGKWLEWGQGEANQAIANTVRWLKENKYRNVFIDVDNEGMAKNNQGFDNQLMVLAGKKVDSNCIIATNFKGKPPAAADMGIHFSKIIKGKPYIQSEATPLNAPGGYWGTYSKKEGYYNYINIGVYSEDMKRNQIEDTQKHLDNGLGYMLASTWLQSVPPYGPNQYPGGYGSRKDPGIKWWLEFIKENYGSYNPPPVK
jgi:hypothetical protein